MYKAGAGPQGPVGPDTGAAGSAGGAESTGPDEKVVDAEFEEVDEKKKRSA
jgi:hypothetical protein